MKTVTTKNKTVRNRFKNYVLSNHLSENEVIRYKKTFGAKWARAIYEYGNLDVYDYDLYCTLREVGVTTKPVMKFEEVLDTGCTYKHRENLRSEYVKLIYNSLKEVK